MDIQKLFAEISEFSDTPHGNSDFHTDLVYLVGKNKSEFAPLRFIEKKFGKVVDLLIKDGFVYDSFDLFLASDFKPWFEGQYSRKLKRTFSKKILFLHLPDNKKIFDAIETVNKSYEILADQKVLMNNKKLPVQLGEWFAKSIFGLEQRKSTSQRGFDFFMNDKRTEVKAHWGDHTSPKGIKIRKSLVELSDYCILIYVARNFMIREICFLDSNFILRKFSGKGHTIFLKDSDVSSYFFSKSDKHFDKVVGQTAMMKYSTPVFAMKLSEKIS